MAECGVLIIAEHRQIREVLHQIFLSFGYNCLVANDGREGLKEFRKSRPPLVITQLNLPHHLPPSGAFASIELLKQVHRVDPDAAVIVISDSLDRETATECLKLGAEAYIRTPLNVDELLTAVERALEARHRTPPTPAPPPRPESGDDGPRWRTPEQFLRNFEYHSHQYPSDPQFSDGIPIIRAWMNLRSRRTVSQTDLDGLLNRFAAAGEGMHIYDLWLHVVRWGDELGLSTPWQHPWQRP